MKDDNEYFWHSTSKEGTYEVLNRIQGIMPYDVRLGPPLLRDQNYSVTYEPGDHAKGKVGIYVKDSKLKKKYKFPSLEEALDWAAKHHNISKDKLELKM